MSDPFTLPTTTSPVEHRVRGSRLIATTLPIGPRKELGQILGRVRVRLPDATHICCAYRLGDVGAGVTEFATDAGEPAGSAGKPILNVLRQAELVNVAARVVHYYGGTKLGIPGLIGHAADAQGRLHGAVGAHDRHQDYFALSPGGPSKVDVRGMGGKVRNRSTQTRWNCAAYPRT